MKVVVFLASIADPKWPLQQLAPRADGLAVQPGDNKAILSPFDEAALEIALKIRDSCPGTTLSVVMPGGSEVESAMRTVAAFCPDQLLRLDSAGLHACDARVLARQLAGACAAQLAGCDLILIGREFGDTDNGSLPPCLAEQLGHRFLALIQDARWAESQLALMRERDGAEEWIAPDGPVLASVTNDRRNRLRHPLMKNVMAARRASFAAIGANDPGPAPELTLQAANPARSAPRAASCQMLSGALEQRTAQLADYLLQWKQHE